MLKNNYFYSDNSYNNRANLVNYYAKNLNISKEYIEKIDDTFLKSRFDSVSNCDRQQFVSIMGGIALAAAGYGLFYVIGSNVAAVSVGIFGGFLMNWSHKARNQNNHVINAIMQEISHK